MHKARIKKVLLYDENDETPRNKDLSALILCNPPALESYSKVVARHWISKLVSVFLISLMSFPVARTAKPITNINLFIYTNN